MADYSALDRLLHRLALGGTAEMIHDIERARFLKSSPPDTSRHVFVTGLARAGTTILMREIHRTGEFASLTYADMPFVLAPNLWAALSRRGRKTGKRAERAHGDGIVVDYQSPEALDEVFWRVMDGAAYIRPDHLLPHTPGRELTAGYGDLMRLVMRSRGKTRYLSKNNNNILRLGPLARVWPRSDFLIPLRDPLQHARSLLSQHKRFLTSDDFTRDYMTWLGHHEFGATHRQFRMAGKVAGDPGTLDYWLRLWIAVHSAILPVEETLMNIRFIPYERLATDPAIWRLIAHRLEVKAGGLQEVKAVEDRDPGPHDAALADEARALHARLTERAKLKLGY